jgi:hypothetical protein
MKKKRNERNDVQPVRHKLWPDVYPAQDFALFLTILTGLIDII